MEQENLKYVGPEEKISVVYVRSNEAYDIYHVSGAGIDKYHKELRGSGIREENIAELYSA